MKAFAADVKALRKRLDADLGPDDYRHLRKIERIGRACTLAGYATAWMAPNPVSSMLMSTGILTRWILTHHISHRGYDRVPGIPKRYTSKYFARGKRRLFDWMDWILPEAWHEEHDFLHHYNLGEDGDPDVVERNTEWVRDLPRWQRQALLGALTLTWKWSYYAPSTMEALQDARARRNKEEITPSDDIFDPRSKRGRELYAKCYVPYALYRFVALPAAFLPLGRKAARNVFLNTLAAELITNTHSFLIIGPNHTGDDLYRFDTPVKSPAEFFLRQIVGSVNYATGNDVVDYLQMWLNYQIEHHLWPDMTMLQYRKAQPHVKALCEKYGIPYVQESVFKRAREMARIIVGDSAMIRVDGLG